MFSHSLVCLQVLGCDSFKYLGRCRRQRTAYKSSRFESKAYGKRISNEIKCDGRIIFDLIEPIRREYKLRSYTLNAVSAHFLGQQKEDVHHSCISDLQRGDDETRRRLAVYCLKDALLPMLLLDKLLMLINSIEMARVTGVPITYLLSRGQQIKVVSQLYRKAAQRGFLIPVRQKMGISDDKYEGATVLDPKTGFYNCPVCFLANL